MNIFFICKQLVDILYEFKILDYAILSAAIIMIIYGFFSKKIYKHLKDFLIWPDLIVVLLCIVYSLTFLRYMDDCSKQYFKTMTAFIIYFLGRIYSDDLLKHGKSIAIASYLVIYVNGIYRLVEYYFNYHLGKTLPTQVWEFCASGAFYHYKTDLALGIIVALVFVYGYGKNNWFKYFTIFPVCAAVVFSTSARMGQLILIVEYVFIILFELRKRLHKDWHVKPEIIKIFSIFIFVCVSAFFIFIQFSIVNKSTFENLPLSYEQFVKCENIFHSRHLIWWDAMNYYSNQPLGTRLFGIDLVTETNHNSAGDRFHCLYMKLVYSVGYIGTYLFFLFVVMLFNATRKKKGSQMKYLTIGFWIMFLLIGISMEALEYTQMSWYPFIFAGAIMSKDNKENVIEKV